MDKEHTVIKSVPRKQFMSVEELDPDANIHLSLGLLHLQSVQENDELYFEIMNEIWRATHHKQMKAADNLVID